MSKFGETDSESMCVNESEIELEEDDEVETLPMIVAAKPLLVKRDFYEGEVVYVPEKKSEFPAAKPPDDAA